MGPLKVKGWVGHLLIITCLTSHTVYIGYCSGLDADTFILLLRRFAATHGAPSRIYSDNAMVFRAASTFLHEVYKEDVTQQFLCERGIRWTFQTPRSPWKGGFFERMVRVVKRALATMLRHAIFSEEQLMRTLTKGAEAVINKDR
ncbi:uncharacterized protein [Macrobrachium rosenbergii]|uniref:uncharacterized protein n=1 Tax=Macrobrachium rosenbergii TaxID=79674 RepID=UPI0034D67BCD